MRFSRQEYWSGLFIFINIHNGLPQGDNLCHLPVKHCEEVKLTHLPSLRLTILGDICKDWTVFFLCFLASHHLWSIKEPGIQAQTRWLFWGTSLLSSGSAGSQIKSLPCLNCLLGNYWLLMQWAERAWTCNNSSQLLLFLEVVCQLKLICFHSMATHSSILAWSILWTEEPGRLYSPWGHKELDVTEWRTLSRFLVSSSAFQTCVGWSHLGVLLKWFSQDSDSVGPGLSLRICTSNQFPSEQWNVSCHVSKQRMSRSSAIAATTVGEPVSPEGAQGANTCPLAAISQGYGFPSGHVWMWELGCKESWAPKNWCFWTAVLEKTLESPLDSKEIQSVHPSGNQSWIFIGRTDAEAETPILWPPDAKNWLGKDPDAGKDWRWKEKGMAQDEMVGWHPLLNGHEFE